MSAPFTVAEVGTVRHQLRQHCMGAGLTGDDLVLVAHELVTNAFRPGGGSDTSATTRSPARYVQDVPRRMYL